MPRSAAFASFAALFGPFVCTPTSMYLRRCPRPGLVWRRRSELKLVAQSPSASLPSSAFSPGPVAETRPLTTRPRHDRMAEPAPAEQPPLTLKVLRLTRPGLAVVREPYAPAGSPLADRTNALQPVLPHLGLTAVPTLPFSFGSIGVSAVQMRFLVALLV